MHKLKQYLILMRFHKPIGIFLLLWPTLWALWIASSGKPNLTVLLVFIAGVILMRAGGCAINDFADRKIDGHVERTKMRPLTTGEVSAFEAVMLFCICGAAALLLVLLFLNRFTLWLSFVAIGLAFIYPFMKRYTHWPQLILGLAFAWSIPMAFAAQTGHIAPIAWLVFIIAVMWTLVYDTQYAMVDRLDDLELGVKSTAIFFGQFDVVIITALQLMIILLLVGLGMILTLGLVYYVGVAAAAMMAMYQQSLIKQREPSRCLKAFLNNHWFGAVVFVGIVLAYLR